MSRRLRPQYRPASAGYRASRCRAHREALEVWRTIYNHRRPHESLGWLTPAQKRAANLEAATVAAA